MQEKRAQKEGTLLKNGKDCKKNMVTGARFAGKEKH
jgi:hypothetical protein